MNKAIRCGLVLICGQQSSSRVFAGDFTREKKFCSLRRVDAVVRNTVPSQRFGDHGSSFIRPMVGTKLVMKPMRHFGVQRLVIPLRVFMLRRPACYQRRGCSQENELNYYIKASSWLSGLSKPPQVPSVILRPGGFLVLEIPVSFLRILRLSPKTA